MFFLELACAGKETCESVWPPNSSLDASLTCESVWPRQKVHYLKFQIALVHV